METEKEAKLHELRRENDELWGYLQANPDIHVRAHMTRNLEHMYVLANQRLDFIGFVKTVGKKPSTSPASAIDASTASSTTPSGISTGKDSPENSW